MMRLGWAAAAACGLLFETIGAVSGRGEVLRISIQDLAFLPENATAHPGDVIEWVNSDIIDHAATDTNGLFDAALAPGESRRIEMKSPGVFTYICRYHPNMTGRIEVK